MAWGPPGETKRERIDFKTKEELLAHIHEEDFKMKSAIPVMEEFAALVEEGSETYYEMERNNHRGYSRFVSRRKNGITVAYVLSSWMS